MFSNRHNFKSSLFSFLFILLFSPSLGISSSDDTEEPSVAESYISAPMSSSLWETLIENGIDPTQWKGVFEYNRINNPAFKKISSASKIPRGTIIYIPVEGETRLPGPSRRSGTKPSRPVIEDTLQIFGTTPTLLVRPGRGQTVNDLINLFCIPRAVKNKEQRANMVRNIRGDLRDFYRLMGRKLSYRDTSFYLPLQLLSDQFEVLQKYVNSFYSSPDRFVPRDSLLGVSSEDICHLALPGDDYYKLAERYLGNLSVFPDYYPYKNSRKYHLSYMAQHIRHYNLNQPLWSGKRYFIPAYLLGASYYRDNPPVLPVRRSKEAIYYSNGLVVSLEYHITRKNAYWKHRKKYLPPISRVLEDGKSAYPDMIIWHRTGLDPETEQILRSKGREHYSLPYIFSMAVSNYYIDENGRCFLIVDPDKNSRNHAGNPGDFRCLWNGQKRISDISIGIEVESGFNGNLPDTQLATAKKLQEVIRGMFIVPDERVLDHRKVACLRGPDSRLLRGRKADGLSPADRLALNLKPVLDPDVLRGIIDPNLDYIQQRQADSTDYWYRVEIDSDLEASARLAGWQLIDGHWQRPSSVNEIKMQPSF